MKHNKTKLVIKHIEVEGSAETITSIVKSLGDLFPGNGEPVQKQIKSRPQPDPTAKEAVDASRRGQA